MLKESFDKVSIADLDIVNPYFRTKDSEKFLESKGIHLISSEYANSNVDVPALPAEAYSIIDDLSVRAVTESMERLLSQLYGPVSLHSVQDSKGRQQLVMLKEQEDEV